MKHNWLRFALLLAFVCTSIGCSLIKPETAPSGTRTAGRPPQTGTNIPRTVVGENLKRESRTKRSKRSKPSPTPKPKREKPPKPAKQERVDEDFVTRGGFR